MTNNTDGFVKLKKEHIMIVLTNHINKCLPNNLTLKKRCIKLI